MELPERGRQTRLGKRFGVTQTAARKWLSGDGLPEYEKSIELAAWAKVNLEWLMTGRGPKRGHLVDTKSLVIGEALSAMPPDERREVLSYMRFKLGESQRRFASDQLGRYDRAIEAFEGETAPADTKPS